MKNNKKDMCFVIGLGLTMLTVVLFLLFFPFGKYKKTIVASRQVLGSGGYGAVFRACIDPYDENCFGFICDMGSLYFSHDAGESFQRHNIHGTLYDLCFDETTEGVVWAVGSGVYKSTDHGKTVHRVFPKEEDTYAEGNNYENVNYWIYARESDYIPQYQLSSIAINRKSKGKNVYVASKVNVMDITKRVIRIYETTDGENFHFYTDVPYSQTIKLDYDEVNDCLIVVLKDKILGINQQKEIEYQLDYSVFIHHVSGNTIAFDSCYDEKNNKNTFVFSYATQEEHMATKCVKTNDLRDTASYIDLTKQLVSMDLKDLIDDSNESEQNMKSYEYYEWINGKKSLYQFPWTICNISVLSEDVIYLYHEARIPLENGINRRTLAYLRYDGTTFQWVFGFPHKGVNTETNLSWQDGDSGYCFGFSSTPQNDKALLFSTIVGIYYTNDCKNVSQLHSKVLERDITLTAKDNENHEVEIKGVMRTTTTGVDVYCTHRVVTDPSDSSHLLMGCTDFGLLQSFDGGNSWLRALRNWENGELVVMGPDYRNTCYDLEFDKDHPNIVYSIWSSMQAAPYSPNASYLKAKGAFGISYDGGTSWCFKSIVENNNIIPYRMEIVYQNNQRIIYIACENKGFFVSYDNGESFQEMNDGIEYSYILGDNNPCIFANEIINTNQGLYAIIGAAASSKTHHGFYHYNEELKKFESISLPKNVAAIRDIVYSSKEDCIYLAAITTSLDNSSTLKKAGGGVYRYKNGEFEQILDETISVFGVDLDSTGRLYATTLDGSIYRYNDNNSSYELLISDLFHCLKNISFGSDDSILYVTSWGGGTEKLVLKEVY